MLPHAHENTIAAAANAEDFYFDFRFYQYIICGHGVFPSLRLIILYVIRHCPNRFLPTSENFTIHGHYLQMKRAGYLRVPCSPFSAVHPQNQLKRTTAKQAKTNFKLSSFTLHTPYRASSKVFASSTLCKPLHLLYSCPSEISI